MDRITPQRGLEEAFLALVGEDSSMPTRGTHHGIDHARRQPDAAACPDGAAHGYRPAGPCRCWWRCAGSAARRRTQLTLGFLVVLPFLLVAAFELGRGSNRRGAPGLVDLATTGAANFTMFTLFAATGFLLVVVFALFAGDTVASEASWSSLRYLLAAPVPRAQLLRQKLVVALGFSLVALVLLPAVAYLAGGLFFGWDPCPDAAGHDLRHREGLIRLGW